MSAFTDPIMAFTHVQKYPNKYNMLVYFFDMKQLAGFNLGLRIKESNYKIKVILINAHEYIEGNSINFELFQKPLFTKIVNWLSEQLFKVTLI